VLLVRPFGLTGSNPLLGLYKAKGMAERKGFPVLLVRPFGLAGSNPLLGLYKAKGMAERKGFPVLLVRPFGLTGSNPLLGLYKAKGMAERKGFEPPIPFPVYLISNQAPSATRPPLHSGRFRRIYKGPKIQPLRDRQSF
jgi:hypothetical protein